MNTFDELWELVQKEIQGNVSETIYEIWLKDLKLQSFDGETAVIAAPEWRAKIVSQKFLKNITEAFEKQVGFEVAVEFVKAEEEPDIKSRSTSYDEREEEEESTFETFVVGASNRFAHAAAVAVAEKPGATKTYNPLFIYGNSGLGKTHLLHAISHKIIEDDSNANVILIRGEDLIAQIVSGILDHQMESIREKYKSADVLLVDDVQFVAGKEQTQVEFFHIFDNLINARKQIVLTSDRPPKEIQELDERIRTRFEWGLLADIKAPDLETRMAIINRKAQALGLELPNDVIEYLAENIKNNVRQLEGAVKKLKAYATIHGVSINLATAQGAVKDILTGNLPTPVTVEKIINEVARTFGAGPDEIRSTKRDARTVKMRNISMYVIREMTGLSLQDIGKEFGGRDHTTVMHALDNVKSSLDTDNSLNAMIEDIKKNVSE